MNVVVDARLESHVALLRRCVRRHSTSRCDDALLAAAATINFAASSGERNSRLSSGPREPGSESELGGDASSHSRVEATFCDAFRVAIESVELAAHLERKPE